MADRMGHFCYDNMAVGQVINSLSAKSSRVMRLVHAFTLCCRQLRVSSVSNGVIDTLSQNQMERFCQFAPEANNGSAHLPLVVSVLDNQSIQSN